MSATFLKEDLEEGERKRIAAFFPSQRESSPFPPSPQDNAPLGNLYGNGYKCTQTPRPGASVKNALAANSEAHLKMNTPRWLLWAKELQAISQTGLHFTKDPYDRERFERLREIAAEIAAEHTTLSREELLELSAAQFGYATPKVDVRGVVFRESKMLFVRENMDGGRWTLPGGWADVNESPSEATIREVREESGFETRAVKLLALYDRDRQGHVPPFPYHIYKIFFLLELIGGNATPSIETSEVAFFGEQEIPELSVARVTYDEVRRFFAWQRNPVETQFD